MRWSPQQDEALSKAEWLRQCSAEMRKNKPLSKQIMRLFGYAGTGKTTLARHLAETAGGDVCYAAFTGKAALMMQRNGCKDASTIHALIYTVEERADGSVRFVLSPGSPAASAALIVIDECSMVGEELARDLMSFNRPILVLGDPAQLPPVNGAGFFTEATPDVMLTEIHRQAAENPIIMLATTVREGGRIDVGWYGDSRVVHRGTLSGRDVLKAGQVLVGKNATRHGFNRQLRRLLGYETEFPEAGDRLVCLANDKSLGIFNGGMFAVVEVDHANCDSLHIGLRVESEDFPDRAPMDVKVRREFFSGGADNIPREELRGTQQFNFGYALTTHKAQGSQWPDVIIYDESSVFREDAKRWLYSALTRAKDRLTVVV